MMARRAASILLAAALAAAAPSAFAVGPRPSLFRGVVVADSPPGVRVVSLEEAAQAYQADLRPEDVIVRINDAQVRSIDEFAEVSAALKGASEAAVLVFRNGQPRQLRVHLFSLPVRSAWGIEFIPEHDIRFAQPDIGFAYWSRLGQGFERADKPGDALDAYLNALHNVPGDLATALRAEELLLRVIRQRLEQPGGMADGVRLLRQASVMMERLFDRPLSADQLDRIREQLRETLEALRAARLKTRQPSRILTPNTSS